MYDKIHYKLKKKKEKKKKIKSRFGKEVQKGGDICILMTDSC